MLSREVEEARLVEAWSNRSARRVLAVSGDPGIGKTRLLAELAATAQAAGATVGWGSCDADAAAPLAPLVAALRPLVDPERVGAMPVLGRLFPDLLADGASPPGDDQEVHLAAALLSLVRRAGPVLLVVDDVHWLDRSTAAALGALARDPDLDDLLLAVTYRPGDVGRSTPAGALLAELRRRRTLDHVPLPGLSDEAVSDLVDVLAGDRAGDLLVGAGELTDRSEGNPFFVEELVAHALDASGSGGPLPEAVVDVVEERLADLADDDRMALVAAAVLGRSFDAGDLAATVHRDARDLVGLLEQAVERRLLVEAGPPVGRFEFVHAITRDALLAAASALRITQLHASVADALARHDDHGLVASVAHHLLAAGPAADRDRAVAAALAAARQHLVAFAYDEAAEVAQAGLSAGGAATVDLWQVLGEIHLARGEMVEAREAFRRVVAAAWADGDGVRAAVAACTFSAALGVGVGLDLGVGDTERVEWLETALDLLADRPGGLRSRARAHLAVALYDIDPDRCAQTSELALVETAQAADPTIRVAGWVGRRVGLWRPSASMSDRLHAGAEAVREAEACPASYRLVSRFGHMGDRLEAGDVDDARELLDQAVAIASPLHQPRWDWFGRIARAGLALAEGRWDDAEVLVEAAHDRVGDAIGATPHVTHAVQRFLLDRGSDRVVATERRLGALLAAVPGAPLLMVLHGLALGELGRPEPARAHLAAVVADGLAGVPDDYLRPATLAWAAELAWKLGDREGAAEVATALDAVAPVPDADGRGDARFASIGLAAIAGPVERAKALCAAAAGDRDGAVERLAAAVALLDQVGFVALRDRASDELTTI